MIYLIFCAIYEAQHAVLQIKPQRSEYGLMTNTVKFICNKWLHHCQKVTMMFAT